MSTVKVNELSTYSGTDISIETGKTVSGTASQFKMTDVVQGDVLYGSAADTLSRLAPGTSGQFLQTAGAAANPVWATAGDTNTPYFYAYLGSDQAPADDTWTKVDIDTVSFQTGATYNTTDNRWTPAVAGKYFLHIEGILRADSSNKLSNAKAAIYKNGVVAMFYEGASQPDNTLSNCGISASAILDLDADDYVEFWARVNVHSGTASIAATGGVAQCTHFMGYKLVD